jgi:protein SCO1/2
MELFRTVAWLGRRAAQAHTALTGMAALDGAFSPAVRVEIGKAVAATGATAGSAGHCCCATEPPSASDAYRENPSAPDDDLATLELEDQDGERLSFGAFFRQRPSVISFFYTRCMNPNKCSLNITKLGRLQRRLRDERVHDRVNLAAVTYDPAFDLPQRLRAYGAERGLAFDDRNRMLRTIDGFDRLRRWFDLGVGYGEVTVNRHRSELFVLDHRARIQLAMGRKPWIEDDVVGALKRAIAGV